MRPIRRRTFLCSSGILPAEAAGLGAAAHQAEEAGGGRTARPRGGVERREFDVVVCGGGVAGVCAALAAARCGAAVALVQNRPMYGGNSSSEIRVAPAGSAAGSAWARETGIIEEIMLADRAGNPAPLLGGSAGVHYDLTLMDFVRRQQGLTGFLNTAIHSVEIAPVSNGKSRVVSVRAFQMTTGKHLELAAPHYVDCTGDSVVGYLAGAEYRYGREARSEFGEPLAPVKADMVTLGSTCGLLARDSGKPAPYTAPPWIKVYKKASELGPGRGVGPIQPPAPHMGYWWMAVANPFHQVDDAEEVREELHRHLLGVWNYIKNHSPHKEAAANYVLDFVGLLPGKRESRRLMGDVIVTEHHCHRDERWPDAVCYSGWHIDLHVPGGVRNTVDPSERSLVDANYRHWVHVAPFTLPLRAMYSRNVVNLWMAGRNTSVTHVGLGSPRVQVTLGMMGQAVGTAAAYAAAKRTAAQEAAAPGGPHIRNIQQRLLRDDVRIPGLRNEDPGDAARGARATASSEASLSFGEPATEAASVFDKPLAQVFPVTHGRVETVAAYVTNRAAAATEVRAELYELERIWDQAPGRLLASDTLSVAAGFTGWITAKLAAGTKPGRPYRFVLRPLGPAAGLSWARGTALPTGTTAQFLHVSHGGCDPRVRHLPSFHPDEINVPAYECWAQERISRAIRIDPNPMPFGPENVVNGVAWPIDMPNLWISAPGQPLPQWIELDFGAAKKINRVIAGFDTNLNLELRAAPGFWRAPHCAKSWRLAVRTAGAWRTVFEQQDNYQRRVVAGFEEVEATGLRLEILAANSAAAPSARVYEIRAWLDSGKAWDG